LYRDPIVAANISESDFRIRDLMHHAHPVSVFVVTQPNDKDRLKPLVRILVNMTVRLLTDKLKFKEGRPAPDYKHRLLMMLDEFPALGRLEIMQESLAFVAGYGIKCYLICQDTEQLIEAYGRHESITANCHIQVAFQPLKTQTADWLSNMVGKTTIVDEQITTSGNRVGAMLGHVSRTFQEVGRPLMTPDECMRMPGPVKQDERIEEPGDMLILAAGTSPIYGRQPLYFRDETFSARARVKPPEESDRIKPRRSDGEQVRL
jgi:type IV secretion system protein VirD4